MKIFVTGSEGFVGKELVAHCEKLGMDVTGFDRASSPRSKHIVGDLNTAHLPDAIPENVDALIHLAGLTRDPDCRNKALDCFYENVMGTLRVMRAAEERGVRQFIFASSEWVYDSFAVDEVKDETSPVDAARLNSEYALSKFVSEQNLRQKFQHVFCPVTILRFGIIYGSRPSGGSAVESLFRTVQTQDEVRIGSLQTGRCFIHVSDIAEGIKRSIGLKGFNLVNLQGDKLVTLGDVIRTSLDLTGKKPRIVETDPTNPSIRRVSNAKARELLSWQPKVDLEAGILRLRNQGAEASHV